MGKKAIKVAVKNSKDNAEVARPAWTGNTSETISSLSPSVRKILTGLSVGQIMIVAVSAATLGAFVNSNMKEIGMLKQTTENMQLKIDLLESKQGVASLHQSPVNETKWQEIKSKVTDVQTKHETDFLAISNKFTELVRETANHNSTIQDHETRITKLELELTKCACNDTLNQDYDTRITQLEAGNVDINVSIQTLSAKTTQLEIDRMVDQTNVQTINMTMTQLIMNISANEDMIAMDHTKVEQIELARTLDRIGMQNLNESITKLEFDLAVDQAVLQEMNTSISFLESDRALDRAFTERLNSSITQLHVDFRAQTRVVNDQNLTLVQIEADTEMNKDLILNITDRLSNLDTDKHASDFYHSLELRVSYLEDGLNCTWGNWTSLSNCSSDGTCYRERACESKDPGFTGLNKWCSRKDIEFQTCDPEPVHGGWGGWSSYSACSQSCEGGTETRERACDNPIPSYGGQPCLGNPEETRTCNDHICIPMDCSELDMASNPGNGRYLIYPERNLDEPLAVRCEFDSDGAWTVIQKRGITGWNFYLDWAEYKTGFGSIDHDYWLGNEYIHKLTSRGNYRLKIELTDWSYETKYAVYETFQIAGESNNYRITVYGYSGDAGDGLAELHNGMEFSTWDADNDKHMISNCAEEYFGAWWYNSCGASCLNGEYYMSSTVPDFNRGIKWSPWHKSYSFRKSTMMIQKK